MPSLPLRRRSLSVVAVLSVSGLLLAGTSTPFGAAAAPQPAASEPAASEPSGDFGSPSLDRQHLDDVDNRVGSVAPSAAAKSRASALGTRVEWNRFGTPTSLIKHGGYLATGLGSNAVTAARSFISANKVLFRLTDAGVRNLELVNDSVMSGGRGHAVLFRQTFGGMSAAQDGMITVGVVDGNVAYVSSSAAGNGNVPAAKELTAEAAWTKAAQSVGLGAPAISNVRKQGSWTVFGVDGLSELQRSRLVALPTPTQGVRPAYETIVYEATGGEEFAVTIFVDAVNGNILYRTNRLQHLSDGAPAAASTAALAPTAGEFEGSYTPLACGRTHPIMTNADTKSITVTATAVVPANDIIVKILRNGNEVGGPGDTAFSPEVSTYDEGGDNLTGTYEAQVCPFDAASQVAPPYTYVGSYVTTDVFPNDATAPPRWKYFTANPPLNGADDDTRIIGCFTGPDGQTANRRLPAGCQREEGNVAARLPWDVDPRTTTPSFTTRGNAARTAEAWLSPLTPAEQYSPVAPDRRYIFPWNDQWRNNECNPAVFAEPGTLADPRSGRNDIDAAITSLFSNHNRMHDWSYFLGFTENNYNMQISNFGNTAPDRENDPEIGNAQAGAVTGGFPSFTGRDNANQITLNDGIPGVTNMYLWQPLPAAFYASCTDGDFDQSVIGHEYTHAISNRMVGGPDAGLQSMSDGQARAMGESYSDITAVEYLLEYKYVPTANENPFAVGPYVTGSDEKGIRNYGMNNSPLNFSDVQGYDGSGVGSPHDDGEIWSAVNYDIREAMIAKYNGQFPAGSGALQKRCADGILPPDKCPGNRRWMQTVFDAYLMMPPAVSMLGSRDAYLAADWMRYGGTRPGPDNQKLLWDEFAKRGFGQRASTDGTDDPQPKPSFESPRSSNEATVTFKPVNRDREVIEDVQIFVGDYEGRVTPVADTDATTPLDETAKFLPGTYEFVVQAPGYGLTRTTWTFGTGGTRRVFLLVPNLASANNGATITGDGANLRNLIDDTEASNYVSGAPGTTLGGETTPSTAAKVPGRQVTVDLAGGRRLVDVVKVSALLRSNAPDACDRGDECDPQDLSQNRFSALRQFAVEVCTATTENQQCSNRSTVGRAGDGWARTFTSRENAFPGSVPRPLAPNLIFREFDVPDRRATHVRMVVLDNQCTGNPQYHGDQDNDPLVNSDCRSESAEGSVFPFDPDDVVLAPQDTNVRAAEFQVFSAGGEGGGGSGTPQDPFVTFTKTGPLTADQGQTITYTMDYTNLGPAASEQVRITDQLPKGVTFVSASGPDSYNSSTRTVTWRLGTVDVLEDGAVTLRVRVAPGVDTGSVLTNTATFSGALTTATPAVAATVVL